VGWGGVGKDGMERASKRWVGGLPLVFSLLLVTGCARVIMCRCLRPVRVARLGEYKGLSPRGACLLLEAFG